MGFASPSLRSTLIACFSVIVFFSSDCRLDAAAVVEQSEGCPVGYVQLGLQCYSFSTDRKTWYDSFKTCNKNGARLATLSTSDDNLRLKAYLLLNFRNVTGVNGWWIGGTDEALEGDWRWSGTTTEIVYADWCDNSGEPNNDNGENCLSLSPSCKFQWNDRSCDYGYFRYICERYDVSA